MKRRKEQIEESVARYLHQLDSADRQEPSLAHTTKTARLKDKIATLKEEMQRLEDLEVHMLATPDRQISLTDPDARSMATSGGFVKLTDYNPFSASLLEAKPLKFHIATISGLPRFCSNSA